MSTAQLLAIQTSIQNSIVKNEGNGTSLIKAKPPLSVNKRMEIYSEAYRIRLVESLRDDFERFIEKVGKNEFEELAFSFIRECPSHYQNLAEYSGEFINYLALKSKLKKDAIYDWLEIQTQNVFDMDEVLLLDDLKNISPDKLWVKLKLNTKYFTNEQYKILSYQIQGRVCFLDMNKDEIKLIGFLETSRSIDQISKFCEENFISDSFVSEWILNWMEKNIINVSLGER